ncbi:unnamed protein product [Clavelina lepadiformis]|uniref:C2H2-type domain-containing protein n=1 Tax=Clavelina lepadiformis TaxID=159417 RepID=A0ABP0F2Z7_CLALP
MDSNDSYYPNTTCTCSIKRRICYVLQDHKNLVEHNNSQNCNQYTLKKCFVQLKKIDVCKYKASQPTNTYNEVVPKKLMDGKIVLEHKFCCKMPPASSKLCDPKRTHAGEKRFKCEICNKKFMMPTSLKNHTQAAHVRKRHYRKRRYSYRCDICSKGFYLLSLLTAHRKSHGEKNFQCTHCSKKFNKKKYLEAHVLIHTGMKPYECRMCFKTFIFQGQCKNHMRTHFEERSYKCHICAKSFKQPSALTSHRKTHFNKRKPKIYRCTQCTKMYSSTVTLKNHLEKIHSLLQS